MNEDDLYGGYNDDDSAFNTDVNMIIYQRKFKTKYFI